MMIHETNTSPTARSKTKQSGSSWPRPTSYALLVFLALAIAACSSSEGTDASAGSGPSSGSGETSSNGGAGGSGSTAGSGGNTTVTTTTATTSSGSGGAEQSCILENLEPKRVFHIGHSLSDRMDRAFNNLVEAHTGQPIAYFTKSIPGSSLQNHWNNAGSGAKGNMGSGKHPLTLLQSGQFDVLSITEGLPLPKKNSGTYANLWVEQFLDNTASPDPRVFIYSTWDRRKTNEADDPQSIATWLNTIDEWQQEWEAIAQELRDQHPSAQVHIIPAGLVLKKLQELVTSGILSLPDGKSFRETFFKQNRPGYYGGCGTPDHIHLSKTGIYVVALAHYAAIYQSCPIGLPAQVPYPNYDDGCIDDDDVLIDPAFADELQQVTWDVVRTYAWSGIK